MVIKQDDRFKTELKGIFDYIAKDSRQRAVKFKSDLFTKIDNLKDNPKEYRASYYIDNPNARDLIFKGYTIPYLVDDEVIIILGIFNLIYGSKNNKRTTMQTITIHTNADKSIIEAIKTLILASDKEAIINEFKSDYKLSKDDTQDFLNTYELYKKNKLDFMSSDEFKNDLLANGYKWK